MTKEEFIILKSDIYNKTNKTIEKYPMLRLGQALFNETHKRYPDICNKIVGTKDDPFYNDKNIPSFWNKLYDMINL